MLADVVVPPLVDFVVIAAGILMKFSAVRNRGKIVEGVDQPSIIIGQTVGPLPVDRIEQKRDGEPHSPKERHGLVNPIAVAVFTREGRGRRQDKDGTRRYCHGRPPSARKLRQSPQSVASRRASALIASVCAR